MSINSANNMNSTSNSLMQALGDLLRIFFIPAIVLGLQVLAGQTFSLSLLGPVIPFILYNVYVLWRERQPSPLLGHKAPTITSLKFLQGKPFDTELGSITVIEFWATWCPPCKASIPHINKLYKDYKDKGVRFVGVTAETENVVRPFINRMGDQFLYPVALDVSGEVSKAYPHNGIPHAVVVDSSQTIQWIGHPMTGLEAAISSALAKVVASGKPSKQHEE